jgi:thiol-disulfide isomerase/thioredoxin
VKVIRACQWTALVLITGLLQTFSVPAFGQPPAVAVYLFWQRGCPHCERAIEYLTELEARDAGVDVLYLELAAAKTAEPTAR